MNGSVNNTNNADSALLTEFPGQLAVQLQRTVDELRCCSDDVEAIASLTRCLCRCILLFPEQCAAAMVAGVTFKCASDYGPV